MPVQVKVPRMMRPRVGGAASVEGTGATVREVLKDLETRYPGFSGNVLTEEGEIHRFVNLYVNGEDIRFMGALDAPVSDGDTLSILPAVAGGVPPARS